MKTLTIRELLHCLLFFKPYISLKTCVSTVAWGQLENNDDVGTSGLYKRYTIAHFLQKNQTPIDTRITKH